MAVFQRFEPDTPMSRNSEDSALANAGGRVTRERIATETIDVYGRPTRRIAERLTIEPRPLIWNIHPPGARPQLYVPRRERLLPAVARAWGRGLLTFVFGIIAGIFLLTSLVACSVIGWELSGRNGYGALYGIGVWALALMLWALIPRRV